MIHKAEAAEIDSAARCQLLLNTTVKAVRKVCFKVIHSD